MLHLHCRCHIVYSVQCVYDMLLLPQWAKRSLVWCDWLPDVLGLPNSPNSLYMDLVPVEQSYAKFARRKHQVWAKRCSQSIHLVYCELRDTLSLFSLPIILFLANRWQSVRFVNVLDRSLRALDHLTNHIHPLVSQENILDHSSSANKAGAPVIESKESCSRRLLLYRCCWYAIRRRGWLRGEPRRACQTALLSRRIANQKKDW